MGQLINGKWVKGSVSNNSEDGGFKRLNSIFSNNISKTIRFYKDEVSLYQIYLVVNYLRL